MRVIVICFVIIAFTGLPTQGGVIEHKVIEHVENEHSVGERVKHLMKKRCTQNSDDEHFRIIEEKLEELKPCIIKLMPTQLDDEEGIKENCFEHREEVVQCFREFVEALKPCLNEREEFLPKFLMTGFEEYTNFFCNHSDILSITEMLETNMAKCVNRLMKNEDIRPSHVCFETGKLTRSHHVSHNFITKRELCRDLDNVYHCYEDVFKEECPDSPKAWEFEGGLINALKSGC